MQEPTGVFMFEFFWQTQTGGGGPADEKDWHVITVNCNDRWVFCNSYGYIPFSYKARSESEKTHATVAALFSIRQVTALYQVY